MAIKVRETIQEPQHYPESKVRFSFSKCDTKKYCILKLAREELERLYATLGKLERHTWKTMKEMARENGISIDKKDSPVYPLLQLRLEGCTTFGHFRVDGTTVNMRIFIGMHQDLAYILCIDREGKIQH